MPEEREPEIGGEVGGEVGEPTPVQPTPQSVQPDAPQTMPTSPQRRMIGDYRAIKAMENLRKRLGEDSGEYHKDAPEKGPTFFTEPVGPMGHYVNVSFKNDKTTMQLCARGNEATRTQTNGPAIFMEKIIDGYNTDSAARFVKQAKKIIEEMHSMY